MLRLLIASGVVIAFSGLGALVATENAATADARQAIERSLDYIEREGFAWMDGRVPMQKGEGCVSCHHVSYGVWSLREAERLGIRRPDTKAELLERRAMIYLSPDVCRPFSCAPLLLARAGTDEQLRALTGQIVTAQEEDGGWHARGQFPTQRRPIEESDTVATMWTMLAQDSMAAAGSELSESRAAASRWLSDADVGESTEWILLRFLVDRRAGDGAAAEPFLRRLLDRQNEDGGWPWRSDQVSDAMTSGQVVYGLAIAGVPEPSRAPLRSGVAYLLSTQGADGTWATASALISTEPGEAKDYIYTYWGTTWASIGLSRALAPVAE